MEQSVHASQFTTLDFKPGSAGVKNWKLPIVELGALCALSLLPSLCPKLVPYTVCLPMLANGCLRVSLCCVAEHAAAAAGVPNHHCSGPAGRRWPPGAHC